MKLLVPIFVLVAACGGGAVTSVDITEAPVATASDRPVAPDFSLELSNGGTYTLSEGEKPVYMVFWAEW